MVLPSAYCREELRHGVTTVITDPHEIANVAGTAGIDFMLSQPFQEDMPLQMFVYPVLPGAQLPEAFQVASQVITDPARLDPALIAANREAWVQAWTDLMLK